MGITSSNKVVDRSEVSCDGEFQVTLAPTTAAAAGTWAPAPAWGW